MAVREEPQAPNQAVNTSSPDGEPLPPFNSLQPEYLGLGILTSVLAGSASPFLWRGPGMQDKADNV